MTLTEYRMALGAFGFTRPDPERGLWERRVGRDDPLVLTVAVSRAGTTLYVRIGEGEPPFVHKFKYDFARALDCIDTYIQENKDVDSG